MKIRDFFLLLCVYTVLFIAGTFLYIASFHTSILSNIDVFFYRGLVTIILCGIIISLIMLVMHIKMKQIITIRDVIILFVVFCCVHVVIFTHLPVTADRSISVFMLGYMADNEDDSFSEEEIEEYFIEKYVKEYKAFSKRFHEQEETGTIENKDNKYKITENGKKLMKIYDIVADMYCLDDKLIHSCYE